MIKKIVMMMSAAVAMVCVQAATEKVNGITGNYTVSGVTNLVTSADGPAALQAAIEAANEGDVILVGPGKYSPIRTNSKKITIQSTEGAANTIIDGGNTNRCATLADDTMGDWWLGDWAEDQYVEYTPPSPYNITLIGFTLCNGKSYWKGHVEYYEDGSQENILPSRAFEGGGAFGGVLVDCVVSNNVAEFIFEKGSIYYETDEETGEMVLEVQAEDDNEARGGGVSFAKLYNCLVTKNKAPRGGSGIDNCYAYNCTIVGNYCETREEYDFDDVFDVENSEIYNTIMSVTPYWGGGYAMDVGDVKAEGCAIVSETGSALQYNYFDECWNGNGDIYSYDFIVGDMKFVNPSIGDYRLQQGSVAIDAGNESYVQPLNTQYGDLDGNIRVRDAVDIGAYESVSITYSYDQIANGEIVLTDIIGEVPENWVCPSMYEGKKVVGLGDHFLAESEEIRSVVLADTIREVGESAFKKCPNLSSVMLNEGLEIIRGYAFRKCFSLESVILPSSIAIIEERAFCRSGENYRWDEGDGIGIQRIEIRGGENDAFSCEDGVLYDKINKKVIMARANIERVVLPEDCTRIGDCALLSCYNLNEVVWNTALSEIGDEAFAGTYLTTGDLSKTSLTLAQEQAFAGCPLKEVVLPATLQTVGSHLFGFCDSLESVHFLGNAPAIDNSAEETEEGFPNGDIYVTISSGSVADVYDIYLPKVTTFIEKGTSGWGVAPGTWQGCPIAYWGTLTETVYEMSFASGGATDGDAPEVISFKANEEVELPGCGSLSWLKHTFIGWSDGISTYDSGEIYTGKSNVVMTAQWARNELAAPVISAPETFESDTCEVTITCDSVATIHYTLDGADPTIESPIYMGPIMITGTTEIKAIAIRDNYFDSSIASFTVTRGVWTFGEYLNWPGQEFETSGDVEWIREKDVSDDGYALKSGKILRNQKSCFTTTVQGAGTISFMLKVSSEADEETGEPYDGLVLAVDGVDVTELFGGKIDWRRVSFKIVGDGLHNIEWRYEKDKSVDAGEDCAWIDEVVWSPEDPIPELGASATASEVAAALDGSADANLSENIKTAAEYAAYRTWALGIEGVTAQQVKESPNAWLSFALDSDGLIAAVPKEGDVVIDAFGSATTEGSFEFTVKIDGIEVGDNALESNIRKVFDIEGTKTLASGGVGFSFDNVVVNVATPENGNVKFAVTPKGGGEGVRRPTSFFFRVKMR